MTHVPSRVTDYLDSNGIAYDVLLHRRDLHARDAARDTHTPEGAFAKTLLVAVNGTPAMAVLPASHTLSERRLRQSLQASSVELLEEHDIQRLCPDCELGAAPPLGGLYGLPVYVSPALGKDASIVFNAGTHEHVLRMRYADFAALVQPRTAHMARRE